MTMNILHVNNLSSLIAYRRNTGAIVKWKSPVWLYVEFSVKKKMSSLRKI